MDQIKKIIFYTLSFFYSINLFSQRDRGRVYEETESYDWSEFDSEEFIFFAILCAVIIGAGLALKNNSNSKFLEGLGTTLVVIGSVVAFIQLGGPILSIISTLWTIALIGLFLYFIFGNFFKK